MLGNVKKIMDRAKAEKVDVGVAQRKLISEGADNEKMVKALELITKNYEELAYLYGKGDDDSFAKVVAYAEDKDYGSIRELMEELRKQG